MMEQLEKTSTPVFNLQYDLKYCSSCQSWKPSSEFHINASKPDGLQSHCAKCHCAYAKRYGQTEQGRAAKRRYAQSSKGRIKGMMSHARYRSKHHAQVAMYQEQYEREHPHCTQNRYHRFQDKFNWHKNPYGIMTEAKLVQALLNAPVVEVKV